MKMVKILLAAAALVALASVPAAAQTPGKSILFSSSKGDLVFPITPPNASGSVPGTIDNMVIGSGTPKAGSFTTLSATSAPTGAGITALFASPPAIGGTAAAPGTFSTVTIDGDTRPGHPPQQHGR